MQGNRTSPLIGPDSSQCEDSWEVMATWFVSSGPSKGKRRRYLRLSLCSIPTRISLLRYPRCPFISSLSRSLSLVVASGESNISLYRNVAAKWLERCNRLATYIQLIGLLLSSRGWYDLRCITSRPHTYTHIESQRRDIHWYHRLLHYTIGQLDTAIQEINSGYDTACCPICNAGIYLEYIIKFIRRVQF